MKLSSGKSIALSIVLIASFSFAARIEARQRSQIKIRIAAFDYQSSEVDPSKRHGSAVCNDIPSLMQQFSSLTSLTPISFPTAYTSERVKATVAIASPTDSDPELKRTVEIIPHTTVSGAIELDVAVDVRSSHGNEFQRTTRPVNDSQSLVMRTPSTIFILTPTSATP